MNDDPGTTAGQDRDETPTERLDRQFEDLLQELRVSQAGVQILFVRPRRASAVSRRAAGQNSPIVGLPSRPEFVDAAENDEINTVARLMGVEPRQARWDLPGEPGAGRRPIRERGLQRLDLGTPRRSPGAEQRAPWLGR